MVCHLTRYLRASVLTLLLAGMAGAPLAGQLLSVDQGLRAAELWCFPLADDPDTWLYLPAAAHLATDGGGLPQFSFVRYVLDRPAEEGGEAGSASTIRRAEGGGVLTFLVLYDTPQEQVQRAEAELRRRLERDELKIRGPVIFDHGRWSLVSSILDPGDGKSRRQLMASGRAPVLEGNRLALSFDLDPERASLLLASLETATPDISLVFDMAFSGLSDAYDAHLMVDWTQVRESLAASAGGTVYFVSADVEAQIDELLRNQSIRLETRGSDAATEALLTHVYDRLLDLLFAPVEPERVPEDQRGDLFDALGAMVGPGGALSSRNTTGFGAYVGFQYKHMKSEGKSVLDFNHRATVERNSFITFQIGDLFRRYGEDPRFFRTVNVGDPAFDQRVVRVTLDGSLLPELESLINHVTVTLRKVHSGGSETFRELVVDRGSFDLPPDALRLSYGWDGDDDRLAWLGYEYRAQWSFKGGGEHRTDWIRTDAPMINLYAPYQRRTVEVVDGGAPLADLGVRAVVVTVEYPFFGAPRRERLVVRTDRPMTEPRVEITLPRDLFDYDYTLTWLLEDGGSRSAHRRDGSGLIFLDAPPASPASGGSQP